MQSTHYSLYFPEKPWSSHLTLFIMTVHIHNCFQTLLPPKINSSRLCWCPHLQHSWLHSNVSLWALGKNIWTHDTQHKKVTSQILGAARWHFKESGGLESISLIALVWHVQAFANVKTLRVFSSVKTYSVFNGSHISTAFIHRLMDIVVLEDSFRAFRLQWEELFLNV